MRPARLLAGIALALAVAAGARGQQAPYETTVAAPEVEVRSGPSTQFYATVKLRLGMPVRVLEDKDGWLAIAPPMGSFSWINDRLIDRTGKVAVVVTEAPVRVGSAVSNVAPTVEQVKLPRGAQVIIVGEAFTPPDEQPAGKWWPIQPPPQERRYVPKESVRAVAAPVETVAAAPPAAPAADKNTWPTPGAAPAAATSGNPLMDQARQAETSGNIPLAIQLYTQVYRQNVDGNHTLAMEALNRVHFLQNGAQGSVPPGYRPGTPAEAGPGQGNRIAPVPAQTVSNQVGYAGRPATQPQPVVQGSGPGRLRRAGFFVDGKQAYVLENSQGRPVMYITPQAGLNLDPYVNRTVELFGPTVYHGDLRTNYMSAAQVNLMQ